MLTARLLGQYEIRRDKKPVNLPTRAAQSLFAFLLLHPHQPQRREMLAGQFWPDTTEDNARSNLRHALWRVRKALDAGADDRLESDSLAVVYHPQPGDWLDVDQLESCPEDESNLTRLLQAVSAYGGELLPGFYEDWIVLERERLRAAFERKLGNLLDGLVAERLWNEALRWGETWIAGGGAPEPAYRALMLAQAGLGNLAGAALQYQRCVDALEAELGVAPSEKTRKLFEQIRSGEIQAVLSNATQPRKHSPGLPEALAKPETSFVGREAELSALERSLNRALHGQPQVIFVRGEAGSGKSALLQAFLRKALAAHPDLAAGWGTCNAFFGQGDPYLPFRDVLAMLSDGRERIENLAAREPERNQLFEQYTQMLRSIAAGRPVLVILDDLQWMDSGTGQLLFHLARRLQNERILIAGAYREEELVLGRSGERHPLEPLLNELQAMRGEITLDLDNPGEARGRAFVDAYLDTEPNDLDETFRRELYRRTQGHPLFTIELLRNLQERKEVIQDENGRWQAPARLNWDSLPPQVEGIIGERIGRLDRELQDLLLTASVEGEQFTLQVLEAVQGGGERVLLQRLSRELEKRHHLVQEIGETAAGGKRLVRFRFVHALIQQYLYRSLGAAERLVLHREIGVALEALNEGERNAVALPLARHYLEAGVKDKAVEYLLIAGDQARSLFAHQEALEHYRQALAFLKESGEIEQAARTSMKLYLVYHNALNFREANLALEESNRLWKAAAERSHGAGVPRSEQPYRLAILKKPLFDPAFCSDIYDYQIIPQILLGLVELSEDRTVRPSAAKSWDVLEGGRRYVFHLREGMRWSDGAPLTAWDFEYAWKRVLDPATQSPVASMLYSIRGAEAYNQGFTGDAALVGISVPDAHTLEVELEDPCGYFPYILGDPISFAIPRHVVERAGPAWTELGQIVSNGAFQLAEGQDPAGKTITFVRSPLFFDRCAGNIESVRLTILQNELEMYRAYVAGELDTIEMLIPQLKEEDWAHYEKTGQLNVSPVPFVDALYFLTDQPPFDRAEVRRAFGMATDRETLARELKNQLPALGGYIPPGLPGYSEGISLPFDPQAACRLLAGAGYPQGRGFPTVRLLMGLVGLETEDTHVFEILREMWQRNLGVDLEVVWHDRNRPQNEEDQKHELFFLGWFADFPDPASFLQMNFLIEMTHWRSPVYDDLIAEGKRIIDQERRLELYRKADRMLMDEAIILPLFYGHIYGLRQPWLRKPSGVSIYNPQWKDIILLPH